MVTVISNTISGNVRKLVLDVDGDLVKIEGIPGKSIRYSGKKKHARECLPIMKKVFDKEAPEVA